MDAIEIPKLLKNGIDLKATTITSFGHTIDAIKSGEIEGVSIHPDTKITLFTAFGMITGNLLNSHLPKSEEEKMIERFHEGAFDFRNLQINRLSDEEDITEISNKTGNIALTNVEVSYYANPSNIQNFSYLLVFADQVVGLTFGNKA
ncbi:hypothetical protein [Bacillus sp. B1-WWTP-T-0.5-Post-4]|uniref:hypothetical protein n=1 Tax=Bacillus sp. B1-WWTP-T-0.5-Post-4 TaxID=2653219 RepID=UPI0012620970|nr:hypothetical protein [Bacillus sp. B1-WWTP-T-0.5-Post-4]KAB7683341.1 hypothetical protein GBN91_00010 [Bacillus sp. B1-WWTP-T-0.5-Post-4]